MKDDCLFCSIAIGTVPCSKVYENDAVLAFHDITPQAPVHVLFIPKVHYDDAAQATRENPAILVALFQAVNAVVEQMGLEPSGYRVVINTGRDGNQTVKHLHLHLLAGRSMLWPPG